MPEVELDLPEFYPKQKLVFTSKAQQILLGGDTRAGKSFCIKKSYILWASMIPGLVLDILRLNWADVTKNYMEGELSFPALLFKWERAGLCKITQTGWTLWNGSKCTLGHCADDNVMLQHQGNPTHFRTVEEACQIPERRIRLLLGWMTMSKEMKLLLPEEYRESFPRIYFPTNADGPSRGFFNKYFVEARPTYAIEKVGAFTRQFIPFELTDNPSENSETTILRIKETFPDEQRQKAYLCANTGENWKASIGGFFEQVWDEERHVVPDFTPPPHWFGFRALDLGYAEPFCCYWVAVADGETFKDNLGRERWFPRGAFIVYREWYGCDPRDPSRGLWMSNESIAAGIKDRSDAGREQEATLADSLPFQYRGGEGADLIFAKCGVPLTKGDCSRVAGWSQMLSRLRGKDSGYTDKFGKPLILAMLYLTESCKYGRDNVPQLPRHPSESKREDAAEHGEYTHAPDTLRIICMAFTVISDYLAPMEVQIAKGIAKLAKKPTINSIMTNMGYEAMR